MAYTVGSIRPELPPRGRLKLEKASADLDRSANSILSTLVDALEAGEITQVISTKVRPEPESQTTPKPKRRIIIKRHRDTTGMF